MSIGFNFPPDFSPATNAALSAANSASLAAASAATAARAVSAAAVAASKPLPALSLLSALVAAGESGFAIMGNSDLTARAVSVVGGSAPFDGDLRSWLPNTVFVQPKQVVNAAGATVWSPHNYIYASDVLSGAGWGTLNATITTGVSVAGITMARLTATADSGYVTTNDITLSAFGSSEANQTDAFLVHAGTATMVALAQSAGGAAVWFDLNTGTVVSQGTGLTGAISAFDADGNALPAGTFLCSVTAAFSTTAHRFVLYPAVTAGSFAGASGKSIYWAKPRANLGAVPSSYIARAASPSVLAVGIPYDWSRGERRIAIDSTDKFKLTDALFPTPMSVYIEYDLLDLSGATASDGPIFLQNSDASQQYNISRAYDTSNYGTPTEYLRALAYLSGGNKSAQLGVTPDMAIGRTFAHAIRLGPDSMATAINGDIASVLIGTPPAINAILLAGPQSQAPTHRLYLKTLIGLPRQVTYEELSAWQGAIRNHPYVRSCSISKDQGQDAASGVTNTREPDLCKVSETTTTAIVMSICVQKHTPGFMVEAPGRLMYTLYSVDRATKAITRLTDGLLYQPSGWSSGTGHSQSPCGRTLQYGLMKGRTLIWFNVLTSASGTFSDDNRPIFGMYSDDGCKTFSAPVQMAVPPGTAAYLILDPGGKLVEYPADGAYPLRVVAMAYTNAGARAVYSDDQGATIKVGNAMPALPGGYVANEATCALLPDGRLVATMRNVNSSGTETDNIRFAAISTNGGVDWGTPFQMPGFQGSQVAASAAQLYSAGERGRWGRVAQTCALGGTYGRNGGVLSVYGDDSMTALAAFNVVARARSAGYSSIVQLWGGEAIAHGVEQFPSNSVGFNGGATSCAFRVLTLPALP